MTEYEKQVVSNLKLELARVEEELVRAQTEVDRITARKKQILDELAQHSDQRYEEDMLARVYDQRRKH